MKFTPSVVIDAPSYYVNHFDKKHNVDKCTILRDMELESDTVVMPSCLSLLAKPTHILDLTNNNLSELPDLRNRNDIHTLLLGRNRINGNIDGKRLPRNLKYLVLASNNISELTELNGLRDAPRTLTNVSLLANPICHLDGYRQYVLTLLPMVNMLDFISVPDKERQELKKKPVAIAKVKAKTTKEEKKENAADDKSAEIVHMVVSKMTDDRRQELKKQLAEASSLKEIARIEKLLSGGV